MGENERGSGTGLFKNFRGAGKKEEGDRGRGLAAGRFSNRERGRSGRRFGEGGVDRRARPVSGRERERGREEAGWARPKKGRGGGLLSLQAEKRKGKRGKGFLFFYTHFSK